MSANKNNGQSERQETRQTLDWIRDMKQRDVDEVMKAPTLRGEDSSMRLVYEDCGIETNILLWRTLSSVQIYVSERPLNELRRRYVRRFFDPDNPADSVRDLAVRLGCSEKFVRDALAEDPKEDPRQEKMKL